MSATIRIADSLDSPTGTVTLNTAFLEEIKDVNQELWVLLERLRYLCSRPISMRSQSHELVELVVKLRDLIAMQFSLEEAYGYFENPVSVDPRLSKRADELRSEHQNLYAAISRIAELAEDLLHQKRLASLTTIVPVDFDRFYFALRRHERLERELMSEALLKEIGTGD